MDQYVQACVAQASIATSVGLHSELAELMIFKNFLNLVYIYENSTYRYNFFKPHYRCGHS